MRHIYALHTRVRFMSFLYMQCATLLYRTGCSDTYCNKAIILTHVYSENKWHDTCIAQCPIISFIHAQTHPQTHADTQHIRKHTPAYTRTITHTHTQTHFLSPEGIIVVVITLAIIMQYAYLKTVNIISRSIIVSHTINQALCADDLRFPTNTYRHKVWCPWHWDRWTRACTDTRSRPQCWHNWRCRSASCTRCPSADTHWCLHMNTWVDIELTRQRCQCIYNESVKEWVLLKSALSTA